MAWGTSLPYFFSVLGAKFSSPASNGGDSYSGIAILRGRAFGSAALVKSYALRLDSKHFVLIF
jgi:hypothetical protein